MRGSEPLSSVYFGFGFTSEPPLEQLKSPPEHVQLLSVVPDPEQSAALMFSISPKPATGSIIHFIDFTFPADSRSIRRV
jgi:hypothetical protein